MFSLKIPARFLAATLAIAGLLIPAIASAQYAPPPQYDQPQYAPPPPYGQPQYPQPPYGQQQYPPPPYGQPQYGQDQTIHGRIYSINSTFNITVTDDNGYMDNVELHQGTVINPTGLTLAPGMEVTIAGYGGGSAFEANEIDTPYAYYGPQPVPVYYGGGWWYPGYAYGYGPSFLLDIVIGGGGWRYERHDFDRNFWAFRSDNRFRGNRGFAPRTVPGRNDGGRGYGNSNANANYSNRGGNYTPNRTWNGNANANGNANYSGRNNGNGNANYSGRNNGSGSNGNTDYRSAPQGRPAYTRSTGANESRTTNTSGTTDNGKRSDHQSH